MMWWRDGGGGVAPPLPPGWWHGTSMHVCGRPARRRCQWKIGLEWWRGPLPIDARLQPRRAPP